MRIRLAPCIVKEVREFEGSYYVTLDAPNETLKATIRPEGAPQLRETIPQLVELNTSFDKVDLEASVRAYISKTSGQQIELQTIQIRPLPSTGETAKKPQS